MSQKRVRKCWLKKEGFVVTLCSEACLREKRFVAAPSPQVQVQGKRLVVTRFPWVAPKKKVCHNTISAGCLQEKRLVTTPSPLVRIHEQRLTPTSFPWVVNGVTPGVKICSSNVSIGVALNEKLWHNTVSLREVSRGKASHNNVSCGGTPFPSVWLQEVVPTPFPKPHFQEKRVVRTTISRAYLQEQKFVGTPFP